jgi:4-hydroxy-tetrahydrodipicolinate synthase
MKVRWKGVYPALTTAFTAGGKLDLKTFEQNVKAQIKAGIDGMVIGGSLGEASTLSQKEKMELLKSCKKLGKSNRIPTIVNVAERRTKTAIAVAQEAEAKGADGLMVLPPLLYKSNEQETVDYFLDIAKSTSLPIMVYNNPVDYKIEVTPDMFEVLLRKKNIQAVKESTRDVSNVTRLINRFGKDLKILCGVDTIAMEELVMGADGWVAGLVDAFPEETVAIYRLVKAGRIEEALQIHRWFLPILELDISPQLVQNIKLAEVMTGLGTEHVRSPRQPLTGKERKRVIKILEEGLKTRPKLPNYLKL